MGCSACAAVSDRKELFTRPWMENKTPQIDTSRVMEKCRHWLNTHTHTHNQMCAIKHIHCTCCLLLVDRVVCLVSLLWRQMETSQCLSVLSHFKESWKPDSTTDNVANTLCCTHIVLYDLFNPGHSEDEDERNQCGVATGRWYIRDLLGTGEKSLLMESAEQLKKSIKQSSQQLVTALRISKQDFWQHWSIIL